MPNEFEPFRITLGKILSLPHINLINGLRSKLSPIILEHLLNDLQQLNIFTFLFRLANSVEMSQPIDWSRMSIDWQVLKSLKIIYPINRGPFPLFSHPKSCFISQFSLSISKISLSLLCYTKSLAKVLFRKNPFVSEEKCNYGNVDFRCTLSFLKIFSFHTLHSVILLSAA